MDAARKFAGLGFLGGILPCTCALATFTSDLLRAGVVPHAMSAYGTKFAALSLDSVLAAME